MTSPSASAARSGSSGRMWEGAARVGFALSGLIQLILGFLIVRLAMSGGGDGETDSNAALSSLADAPAGTVVLWLAVGAWVALGAWCLVDAVGRASSTKDRASDAGKAVVYAALALSAASIASGADSSDSDAQAQGFAGSLMAAPAGRLLVGLIGLAILGVGAYLAYKGITRKFEEDLVSPPAAVRNAGVVGYPAKGLALAVVGSLFAFAAITADADKAEGLDGAIDSLLGAPFGPFIVGVVGLGFAAYGVYSFGRAKYARM